MIPDSLPSLATQCETARLLVARAKSDGDRQFWNEELSILTQSITEELRMKNRTWFISNHVRYRIDGAGDLVRDRLIDRPFYISSASRRSRGKASEGKVRITSRKAMPT